MRNSSIHGKRFTAFSAGRVRECPSTFTAPGARNPSKGWIDAGSTGSYSPLLDEARKRGLNPAWLGNHMDEMRAAFDADTSKVLHSAQRLYGQ